MNSILGASIFNILFSDSGVQTKKLKKDEEMDKINEASGDMDKLK